MTPGRRQGAGCWTCRLRRKRCDSIRPTCGECQHLEITCYADAARPAWMDGGTEQKLMSERIKMRIRQNALLRKEKRLLIHEDQSIIFAANSNDVSDSDGFFALASPARPSSASHSVIEDIPTIDSVTSSLSRSSVRPNTLRSSIDQSEGHQTPFTITSPTSDLNVFPSGFSSVSFRQAGTANPIPLQYGSLMIYLDYVFPFLFPFYQPSLVETGRQWLLGLLCQNEVSFHIAASLSAYFFTLVPQSGGAMHDECKALVRDRLIQQMDMAITSIQNTVSSIRHRGAQTPLLDRARIMEEITQLLIVQVTFEWHVDWTIHLTPALALFDEIFQSHGLDRSEPSLSVLLSALPASVPAGAPLHKSLPYTADQSALVFFVSLLLFIDIVASTSLGTPPTLQNYHHGLLSSYSEANCLIQLENIVGCRNWPLVCIGKISALCAWKRDAKQSGNFSVVNLVNHATPILQALDGGLGGLDIDANVPRPQRSNVSRLEAYYSRHDRAVDRASIANITRIWAYAAKIYLSVTLSGWQTNSSDTQTSVTKILSLLQTIESPAQVRSLSWPICVAGCLALPSQENDFHRIVDTMGPLGEFGTMFNALNIMQAVWSSRHTIDRDFWDIASSLSILGTSFLLL